METNTRTKTLAQIEREGQVLRANINIVMAVDLIENAHRELGSMIDPGGRIRADVCNAMVEMRAATVQLRLVETVTAEVFRGQ